MTTEKSPHLRMRALIRHALRLDSESGLTEEERQLRHRRRIETLIFFCWGLIVLKCFVVVWVVHHYAMPFSPLWVIAPTVGFAFLATSLYYWLRD